MFLFEKQSLPKDKRFQLILFDRIILCHVQGWIRSANHFPGWVWTEWCETAGLAHPSYVKVKLSVGHTFRTEAGREADVTPVSFPLLLIFF